jgi:hypothetical protein
MLIRKTKMRKEENIKVNCREICCEDGWWMELAEDHFHEKF